MKPVAQRVWLVTFAAVLAFGFLEAIKTVLLPGISAIASHLITVTSAGATTFLLSRFMLKRYVGALDYVERQTEIDTPTDASQPPASSCLVSSLC